MDYHPQKIDQKLLRAVVRANPPAKPSEIRDTAAGLLVRHETTGRASLFAIISRTKRKKLADVRAILDETTKVTLRQCQVEARKLQGKEAAGELEPTGKDQIPTLGEFLTGKGEGRAFSEAVRPIEAARLCSVFSGLVSRRLDEIVPLDLARWTKAKIAAGTKAGTLVRDARMLHSALARAVEWKVISANPLAGQIKRRAGKFRLADIVLEPLEDRVRYLTVDEEPRLRAALAERDDYIPTAVLVSMFTGLRQGELFALTWADIDFNAKTITVRPRNAKSGKVRHVPMNAEVIKLLSVRRGNDPEALVFTYMGHAIVSPKTAWRTLTRAAKIDGFRWHDLRHTFASRLAMAGVDLYVIKELMGHSSITVTEKYAHLQPHRHHEAVAKL